MTICLIFKLFPGSLYGARTAPEQQPSPWMSSLKSAIHLDSAEEWVAHAGAKSSIADMFREVPAHRLNELIDEIKEDLT